MKTSKSAARELRRSQWAEERFRAFMAASAAVVYVMSPDWSEMIHLDGKNFIPDTGDPSSGWLNKYIHPDDQGFVLAVIHRAIASKGVFDLEHRVIRIDGSLGWTHSRAIPILDRKGEIVEWFGAASDITERKRTEETLAAERRLYRTILSNTPDLVYVFDLDHRFVYANDALLQMWGKTWDEAIGRNCLELGYPDWHAAMHDRELEQVISTKRPVRGEVPFSGTHGRRVYDYIFTPVLDAASNVEAVAGATRDVTDLRQYASRLEADVAARTAELKGSVDELERFSYTVAHDLRAPLRAIHGFAGMLLAARRGMAEPDVERNLRGIAAGAKRMDRLIEDLLDYSRIGRSELRLKPVDVDALVRETIEGVARDAEEKSAAMRTDISGSPFVLADPFLLKQALTNLAANALKFVPLERKPVVEIGARREKGMVRIWVRDNGIGIEQRHRERMFKLFERLHGREEYPGTGVGLAIVSRCIERQGGIVGFESVPGEGSRFWVMLAAAESA